VTKRRDRSAKTAAANLHIDVAIAQTHQSALGQVLLLLASDRMTEKGRPLPFKICLSVATEGKAEGGVRIAVRQILTHFCQS
jgi:hypothetical protein